MKVSDEITASPYNLLKCPDCCSEVAESDLFCQECGHKLSNIKNDQPEASAVLFLRDRSAGSLGRLHPNTSKSIVGLPVVAAGVTAVILVGCSILFFGNWSDHFFVGYPVRQAQKAFNNNRFDEAADILERLSLRHQLNESQRRLLNDVYLAKANQLSLKKSYQAALQELSKVSANSSRSALAKEMKASFERLAGLPAPVMVQNSQRVPRNKQTEPTFKTVQKMMGSSSIALSRSQISPRYPQTPSLLAPSTSKTMSKFEHHEDPIQNDSVRYNELLMGYFSRARSQSEKPAEPPALKEWVEQGKPNF